MFKFLRKYSVWILGFGGTLLLIAFLAPDVIQQLAQKAGASGATQATVGKGETIGNDQWQQNVIEAQIIDRIGGSIPGVGPVESPSHWFLLTREADLAGLTPPIEAVAIDEPSLFSIARLTGANPRSVLTALAHLQGVQRLVQMYQSAGRFSDRRLSNASDEYFSSTAVETIVIPAVPEDNGSFSSAVMQEQLKTWENTPKGDGDHGFGYKLPHRFKTEWLLIPTDSITESARVSDEFSSREQRKFWRRNESDPRFPQIGSTSEIPEVVTNAYLEQLTAKKRTEIARSTSEHLREPRRGFDEANGFVVLPEDWANQQLSFETLANTLQEEFSISLPEYGAIAEWTTTENANATPVIGEVLTNNLSDTLLDFQTLVSSAKEFDGTGLYRIQEQVASPILESTNGELLLFRLTETDASRAPIQLAEVKDQVTYDLGRIARWDTLQAESDLIEQQARENGMLATSLKFNSVVNAPIPVSLIDTGVPAILDPATARPLMSQAIVQRISAGDSVEDMATSISSLEQNDRFVIQEILNRTNDLPLDVPVANLPIDKRIFVVQSPKNMALILVRVTGTTPASSELTSDFTTGQRAILQTLISYEELGGIDSIGDAFSFETLAQRHQFKRPQRAQIDVAEEDTEEVN